MGRTVKGTRFRERYGVQILAVNRHGETIKQKISQVIFQLGDVLLIQGDRTSIAALEADQAFRLVGEVAETKTNSRRAPQAIIIFILTGLTFHPWHHFPAYRSSDRRFGDVHHPLYYT